MDTRLNNDSKDIYLNQTVLHWFSVHLHANRLAFPGTSQSQLKIGTSRNKFKMFSAFEAKGMYQTLAGRTCHLLSPCKLLIYQDMSKEKNQNIFNRVLFSGHILEYFILSLPCPQTNVESGPRGFLCFSPCEIEEHFCSTWSSTTYFFP